MDHKPFYENPEPDKKPKGKSDNAMKNIEKINYTLYDISNAVNTARNLQELYQSIYRSLNKLMPLPNFYIALYNNQNKTINFEYFIDEHDDDFPIIEHLEEPGCLTGEVIFVKRPLFLKENMLMERARKNKVVGTIPKVWIGVPLIVKETVIGILCVQHYTDPEYFSHRHLEILIAVSDQIAIAIERKQILDALENKEKTLSLIFDAHPDSILITRMDTGKITNANKAFMDLSGLNSDMVIGKTTQDIGMWKNDRQRIEMLSKLKEKGSLKNQEAVLFLNDTPIHALISSKILELDGTSHIISIIRDITDKKTFAADLSPFKMTSPTEMLIRGMAHDFNNYLSGIMGYLELLNIDIELLSDTQKEHVNNALASSRKVSKLLKQMQALTAPKAAEPSDVNIGKLIVDVFDKLTQTNNPQIRKTIEFSDKLIYVRGYKDEIYQALLNLLQNSIKAIEEKGTPPGSHIRVYAPQENDTSARSKAFPGSKYFHLCIEDNGCGMTQEAQEKVFEPGFSAWKSNDKNGMGLSLSYYIIAKRHQGSIDIDTIIGKGTTVHVCLPLPEKSIFEDQKNAPASKTVKTILVIEDEDMVRDMAVKALQAFGYNTLDASDGEAGLNIFKKNHSSIDAVLLDIIMPKMSGTETFKQMLAIDPNVKVIVASGHVTNQDQKKIFAKASAYLEKPYQIMELKQTLSSLLK